MVQMNPESATPFKVLHDFYILSLHSGLLWIIISNNFRWGMSEKLMLALKQH